MSGRTAAYPPVTATSFWQLMRSTHLLAYKQQLFANGFDDLDALCDMTEEDMLTIGILPAHRRVLHWILREVRCQRLTAARGRDTSKDVHATHTRTYTRGQLSEQLMH